MPVPSTIADLSTTAGSNSPVGGDTPVDGDNHLRAAYSFIAQLRDKLDGTSSGVTLDDPVFSGTASGSLAGLTLVAPTFSGIPLGTVTGSTYTPTLTNVSNATALSALAAKYIRAGNIVHVSGSFSLTPSVAVLTQVRVSLPIASTLTSALNLIGGGAVVWNGVSELADAVGVTATNEAYFSFTAGTTDSRVVRYWFQYEVL